jgi:hypothetical protein
MKEELKVLKSSEVRIQGLHGDEQKKCAALAQQLADVSAQLTSWKEALKEVQNELQLQKERSDMFISFVDGETNKVDIRKLLREVEHLQERINERDVDRVVDSVLNDELDNDVSELEPRASGPEGNHLWRFGEMVGGERYDNLPDLDSVSLPNFPTQDYTPIYEVVQPEPALKVTHSQDLLGTILNQTARPPSQPVPNLSVFDMTEDLPTTNINVEEEVMTIEPSTAGCGVEACSVNFLFFELNCEILCERNFLFIAFRKLEVVRY